MKKSNFSHLKTTLMTQGKNISTSKDGWAKSSENIVTLSRPLPFSLARFMSPSIRPHLVRTRRKL